MKPVNNLDDILGRLCGCLAVFEMIHSMTDCEFTDALAGACDLLEGIIRDFQAGIEGEAWKE